MNMTNLAITNVIPPNVPSQQRKGQSNATNNFTKASQLSALSQDTVELSKNSNTNNQH